ncbi:MULTISPECIES: D-alanyl-D-alanine carboxypeptidase family protein [Inquilinus]|uniref:serine-type D-Ala-D-Ala carboxypeptidase n=1 Tax=Inquilinus ginsengisoli TaxID=363840 RepID=A0ABU1JYR1_9PROT|nr:D-alanyl-D-alanine carboxypeptidase family protein [Inquilinus ginsengisoli]MDR6292684.1 D-alanyl-D-alanine carboxypeptidase (penicillin-binding protein 5/6) [Inquilinus ginsengisoli]
MLRLTPLIAMPIRTLRTVALLVVASLAALPAGAATVDTIAKQAILIDTTTDTVLMERDADARMPTSSMSKMMTAYLVYDALRDGRITLDTKFPVSKKAWQTGGSKMFVQIGDSVRVEDLLRGLLIQSGNDAAVVLAEGLSGSESAFADRMNAMAKTLGMNGSHFVTSNGLPDPEHYSTARDLATLASRMIQDFPQYYRYESEKEFTWNKIKQGNRNPLLYRDMNVDGIKTGHTDAGGYGLTASGVRDNRRLILVVNGLPSMQSRADEGARLLEWGWNQFRLYPLYKAGATVDEATVWLGAEDKVPVTVAEDLAMTMQPADFDKVKVTARFQEPIEAPIAKGQVLGELEIAPPDGPVRKVPLVAAQDTPKASIFRAIGMKLGLLLGL